MTEHINTDKHKPSKSRLLEWQDYSPPTYSRARRKSLYVALRDGVRRAVDYIVPCNEEGPVRRALPVIYQSQRYGRAWKKRDGIIETLVGNASPGGDITLRLPTRAETYLAWFLMHGYAVVVADMRGAGASYGAEVEQASLESCLDELDTIEWIAAQPWCDGNIGMSGISYGAESQLMAASVSPPHLRAINPSAPEVDRFHGGAFAMGGVFRHGWQGAWYEQTRKLDTAVNDALERTICPVDSDPTGQELSLAVAERTAEISRARYQEVQREWLDGIAGKRFWDQIPYSHAFQANGPNSTINLRDRINASGIPVFLITGWFDSYTAEITRLFNCLSVPKQLVIGPWAHGPNKTRDGVEGAAGSAYLATLQVAGIRWFDYWLKGIDNGVLEEPAVTYAVMSSESAWSWRTADRWPPPGTISTELYLGSDSESHGALTPIDAGWLSPDRMSLEAGVGQDVYTVDYAASTGRSNRWFAAATNEYRAVYGDLRLKIDSHGICYTSAAQVDELTVIGHPIVKLLSTANSGDLDFIAFLERVRADDVSEYLTEGMLRASHRSLGLPPYPYFGMPFPESSSEAVSKTEPLSGGVRELTFELYPMAVTIRKDEKLRLTIVHIDAGNTATPIVEPPPQVVLYHDSRYPSHVLLPLLDRQTT